MPKPNAPPKYPGNKWTLRPLSPKDYLPPPFKTPPSAKDIKLQCMCGCQYTPSWNRPLPQEAINEIDPSGTNYYAYPPLMFRCPSCERFNILTERDVEECTGNGDMHFYGDESYRFFNTDKSFLYVYALVSMSDELMNTIQLKMSEIKKKIRPLLEPSDWPFHTNEVRGKSWLAKNSSLLQCDVDALLLEVLNLIGRGGLKREISVFASWFNVSGTKTKALNQGRDRSLQGALYSTIEYITKFGDNVYFTLESQTRSDNGFMDYFVERIGRSMRVDPCFVYMSRRSFVALPQTAPKGSHLLLDLADLIAFVVNRHFSDTRMKQRPLFPLETLGLVHWTTYVGQQLRYENHVGFPTDKFNLYAL